jgi:DNA-binding MarR family transcriptional regulator
MTGKPKRGYKDGVELAQAFELMMQQLMLLGHTLPESAATFTPQQLKVLFTLDFLRGPTPMSTLSAHLGVTPSTLTKVAAGLVRLGLLLRRRSTEDDRVVNASLTTHGRRLVSQIKSYRRTFFASVCARLSASECRKLIESHRHIFETYHRVLQDTQKGVVSGRAAPKIAVRSPLDVGGTVGRTRQSDDGRLCRPGARTRDGR